tara:strand:- start:512 stop:1183 length:672 start_codon:yes stop_codon:yes gene_type:complete
MKNYIAQKINNQNYFTVNNIEVYIKDELPLTIDCRSVINKALTIVPRKLHKFIKKINIGNFKILTDRDLDALYKDNHIYITNLQDSEEDMLDDIIHEIAHSVEEKYYSLIYSDEKIKKEFLAKRLKMEQILKNAGFYIDSNYYKNVSYDIEFDMFLYEKVGYDNLSSLTSSLFLVPYAATSLREYFASGFENIFLSEKSYQILRKISPKLFEKLIKLITIEER